MKPVDSFQNRLQNAINNRNMKPVEIHEKTGISESLISKYLSGNAVARQKKILLLANALNINPVWLMGFNVPMDVITKIDELGNPTVEIPLLGTVKAGYDYLAEENWEGTVNIKIEDMEETSEYFALKIKRKQYVPNIIRRRHSSC